MVEYNLLYSVRLLFYVGDVLRLTVSSHGRLCGRRKTSSRKENKKFGLFKRNHHPTGADIIQYRFYWVRYQCAR